MGDQRTSPETRLRLVAPTEPPAFGDSLRQRAVHAIGGRGDVVRAAPVICALAGEGLFDQAVVHSGAADRTAISDDLRADPGVPEPDTWLGAVEERFGERMSGMLAGFEEVLAAQAPDVVVVYGAGNTALACALAAAKQGLALAHVESGLRADDPDPAADVNRLLIDRLADTLLAASHQAGTNLLAEGVTDSRVHVVGSTGIDTLRRHEPVARRRAPWRALGLAEHRYVFVALRSRRNLLGERAGAVVAALRRLAGATGVVCCVSAWAMDDLEAAGHLGALAGAGVHRPACGSYREFLALLGGAGAVVTDSGAVQDEACAMGVRCYTLGSSTDRPATLEHGMNELIGDDPAPLADVRPTGARPTPAAVPLWDGHAGQRAAEVLAAHYALRRID